MDSRVSIQTHWVRIYRYPPVKRCRHRLWNSGVIPILARLLARLLVSTAVLLMGVSPSLSAQRRAQQAPKLVDRPLYFYQWYQSVRLGSVNRALPVYQGQWGINDFNRGF